MRPLDRSNSLRRMPRRTSPRPVSTAHLARRSAIAALVCVLVLTAAPASWAQEPDDATPPLPTGIPERAEPESPDPGPTGTPLVRDTPGAQAGTRAGSETADWVPYIGSNEIQCTMSNPDPWGAGICSGHHGYTGAMDIAMPVNTVVRAAGPGDVVFVDGSCTPSTCGSAGRWVGIEHPDGKVSRYMHLSSVTVALGAQVGRGDQIGWSGQTGNATMPHTHYDEQEPLYTRGSIGKMWACHGSTLVKYPDVLGHGAWADVPYGSVIRNDGYGCAVAPDPCSPPALCGLGLPPAQFEYAATNVSGVYEPVTGDFDGDGRWDVLWYGPGEAYDAIWYGAPGGFVGGDVSVSGVYEPFSGDFDGDGFDDVFWYGPGSGRDSMWLGSVSRSWRVRGASVKGGYEPVAADIDADGDSDVIWFGAGQAYDSLWISTGNGFSPAPGLNVSALVLPLVGNFDAAAGDDVLWYGAGAQPDALWYSR